MQRVDGMLRQHIGDVIVHDHGVARLMSQELATQLGWDGYSPVMYVGSDGVRCVCPPPTEER